METEAPEVFSCGDCPKVFAKRMDYNRHRKCHDRPYSCSWCESKFGLKTDLNRHRQLHRSRESRRSFKCKLPGCEFRGTSRKDYLWKHIQKKHYNCQHSPSDKTPRKHYEEFTREGESLQDERDLELLEAAGAGDMEKVRDLLSMNTNPSTKDDQERTPLYLAAAQGHGAVAAHLIDHGADIDSGDGTGTGTALHIAAERQNEEMVLLLLKKGAHVNCRNHYNKTALITAVERDHGAVAAHLIDHGADIDSRDGTRTGTALHIAAERQNEEMVLLLLKKGAHVNCRNYYNKTALMIAVERDHGAVAAHLIDHGVDIDSGDGTRTGTALHIAAERGNEEMVLLLLKKGADVNSRNYMHQTALHLAAANRNGLTNTLLQGKNVNIGAKDRRRNTPLSYAVGLTTWYGDGIFNEATTKLLLEAGAKVDQRHWAIMPQEFREQNAKYVPAPLSTNQHWRPYFNA